MLVVKVILIILAIIICLSFMLIALLTFSSSPCKGGYLSNREAKAQEEAIIEYNKRRELKQRKKVENTLESTSMS